MQNLFNEPYVNERMYMTWPKLCKIACSCLIMNITIDEYVQRALQQYLKT